MSDTDISEKHICQNTRIQTRRRGCHCYIHGCWGEKLTWPQYTKTYIKTTQQNVTFNLFLHTLVPRIKLAKHVYCFRGINMHTNLDDCRIGFGLYWLSLVV